MTWRNARKVCAVGTLVGILLVCFPVDGAATAYCGKRTTVSG